MGWGFDWFSSADTDFNFDYGVSFHDEGSYNYGTQTAAGERGGISVFYKDEDVAVFHTYSAYARGLDLVNTAVQLPRSRSERT
jgi:predicted dithiol-disulfide oxidoreductase (DUF899 family)